MTPSDADYAAAQAIGNHAWLWECASPTIAATLRRMIESGEVAGWEDFEDLCQTASLTVGERLDQWDPERGAFSTWVGYVTRGAILDYVNINANGGTASRGRRWRVPLEALTPEHLAGEDTAADAISTHDAAAVREAVEALTGGAGDLLTVRYGLDGANAMTVSDIAQRAGVTRQTVHNHLGHALKIAGAKLRGRRLTP